MQKMLKNYWLGGLLMLMAVTALFWGNSSVQAADEKSDSNVIAVASFAGYDQLWDGIDKIGKLFQYDDTVSMFKATMGQVSGLDASKPWGAVVMDIDGEPFVFGFLPITSISDLEFVGVDDLKSKISETDGGLFFEWNEDVNLELMERDGWLYVFEEGKSELLPETDDPTEFLGGLNEEVLLGARVFLQNVPNELIDAFLASVREQLAEIDPVQEEAFDNSIKLIEKLFAGLEVFTVAVDITENGSLQFGSNVKAVEDSLMANVLAENTNLESVWEPIFDLDNAVLKFVSSSSVSEPLAKELLEFQKASLANVGATFDNVREAVKSEVEDEDDVQMALEIIDNFEEFLSSNLGSVNTDFAFAFQSDATISLGAKIIDGDILAKTIDKANQYFQKELPEFITENLKINFAKFNGYTLSTFKLNLDDLGVTDLPSGIEGKTVNIALALKDDALIFVAGLDSDNVQTLFKNIIKNSGKKTAIGERPIGTFSFPALGEFIVNYLITPEEQVDLSSFLTLVQNADEKASIDLIQKTDKTSVDSKLIINAEVFSLIGDIIKVYADQLSNSNGVNIEDDDLWEDEDSIDWEDDESIEEENIEEVPFEEDVPDAEVPSVVEETVEDELLEEVPEEEVPSVVEETVEDEFLEEVPEE